ncbi:MAG TPA: ester cyclase [Frankiaceae bacterium]|nr:ester cyclase [Frankiaceae bacterium]
MVESSAVIDTDDIGQRWVAWVESGDGSLLGLFAPDFHDHVSGMGREVWRQVTCWFEECFADRRCELHAVMAEQDRVMLWMTIRGRHVGSTFPWMGNRPPSNADVTWAQLHVLRFVDGFAVEHWAVRGDLQALQQIDSANAERA